MPRRHRGSDNVPMARFVVLRHETPPGAQRASHWDFMLEAGERLRTWAVYGDIASPQPQPAEWLADHRLAYLDLEGPLSGDRGSVARYDRGEYRLEREESANGEPTELVALLDGEKLRGTSHLTRAQETSQGWTFSFTAEPAEST